MGKTKKKKVLVIAPGMEIGGIERSTLGLLDAFNYEKYDIDLFLLAHTGELMQYINPKVRLLNEYSLLADQYKPLKKLMKLHHFGSIILKGICKIHSTLRVKILKKCNIYIYEYQILACKFVKKLNKKYDIALSMFQPHSLLIDKVSADLKVGWVHTDLRSAANNEDTKYMYPMWSKLDHIACVSESVRESFGQLYPDLKNRLFVFENINFVRLIEEQSREYTVSDEMNSTYNILTVGRYSPGKNFEKIPEMYFRIKEKVEGIKWFILGYGNESIANRIRLSIHELGLEDSVILLGKKTNPYPYISNCSLFVLPSSDEGKSVVVVEAQILGKPVIITDYPTSSSQLENGIDGVIAPMNFDKCADTIIDLLKDKEKMKRLSDCCRSRDYSNSKEINKIYELYEQEVP